MRTFFLTMAPIVLGVWAAACQSSAPPATQQQPATPTADSVRTSAPTAPSEAVVSAPGCTVVGSLVSSTADEDSFFPPPSETDWSLGPGDASVTIIEYGDFQ